MSKLLEQIMSDIPAADEATIYLKTFEKSTVEEFLNDLLHKRDCSHSELCSIFGVDTSLEQPLPLPGQGGPRGEQGRAGPRPILPRPELGVGTEEPQTSSIKTKIENDDPDNKVEVKTEDEMDDSETLDLESNESIEKLKEIHGHIDKVTEEKVKELERERRQIPKTKSDFIHNRKVDNKIKYEKAMAFYKSGRAFSVHHAAKMFGLHPQTLMKFILTGAHT